jgi:hypothetical protein
LIPGRGRDFSGAKPASYPTNMGDSFPKNKDAWHKTIYLHAVLMLRMCGAVIPLPHTFPWLDVYSNRRTVLPLPILYLNFLFLSLNLNVSKFSLRVHHCPYSIKNNLSIA